MISPLPPMHLTPTLQQEIEQCALTQGISPEQFILQAITEKVATLRQQLNQQQPNQGTVAQLIEKEGFLVFDTEPLEHIDFDALIAQNRDRSWEHLGL
jgi:hypothetical protein